MDMALRSRPSPDVLLALLHAGNVTIVVGLLRVRLGIVQSERSVGECVHGASALAIVVELKMQQGAGLVFRKLLLRSSARACRSSIRTPPGTRAHMRRGSGPSPGKAFFCPENCSHTASRKVNCTALCCLRAHGTFRGSIFGNVFPSLYVDVQLVLFRRKGACRILRVRTRRIFELVEIQNQVPG